EIVPLTLSGTEYAVDLIVEAQLLPEQDGIGEYVLHRIVKSNIEALPIGFTLKNPSFKDYLDSVGAADIATAASLRAEAQARDALETGPQFSIVPPAEPTTADLVARLIKTTEENGFTVAQLRNV